jgi:hypothetical protein
MTAFEILLNKFYDNIENSEPESDTVSKNSPELFEAVKQFIETSFYHGQNLAYAKKLSELTEKISNLFQNSDHEAWSRVKYTFVENDLHIIRRDRRKSDLEDLKSRLIHSF